MTDAAATLELTNISDETAWLRRHECSGPTEPWIAPEGARAPARARTRGPARASGSSPPARRPGRSTLYPDGDAECRDAGGGAVERRPATRR